MRGGKFSKCFPLLLSVLIVLVSSQTTPKPTTAKPSVKPSVKPTTPGGGNKTDPNSLKCKVYNLTLTITNATYDDNLANAYSAAYNKLRIEVEVGVMQTYDEYGPFIGVAVTSFSKATDGKIIVHFLIEFKGNASTHLTNLTASIASGKLGKLSVNSKLDQAECYKAPTPPICPMTCPSTCAPNCYDSCCQQYQPSYNVLPPPPPPPQPACGAPCPVSCAPSCTPACCNTAYHPPVNYGKRHHAPRPVKSHKKFHIFHHKKHHKRH